MRPRDRSNRLLGVALTPLFFALVPTEAFERLSSPLEVIYTFGCGDFIWRQSEIVNDYLAEI
jgi:hypothetical protein